MPKRPDMSSRLKAGGREGFFAPSGGETDSPPDGQPLSVNRQPSTVDRWETLNKRVTFYCPRELLKQVDGEVMRSGRSKSQVIVEALREHLEQ